MDEIREKATEPAFRIVVRRCGQADSQGSRIQSIPEEVHPGGGHGPVSLIDEDEARLAKRRGQTIRPEPLEHRVRGHIDAVVGNPSDFAREHADRNAGQHVGKQPTRLLRQDAGRYDDGRGESRAADDVAGEDGLPRPGREHDPAEGTRRDAGSAFREVLREVPEDDGLIMSQAKAALDRCSLPAAEASRGADEPLAHADAQPAHLEQGRGRRGRRAGCNSCHASQLSTGPRASARARRTHRRDPTRWQIAGLPWRRRTP